MKLLPFEYSRVGEVSHAENSQFLYQRVGPLVSFEFKTKNVSIRPVKALVKEIEKLNQE